METSVTVTLTGSTNTLRLVRPGASASDCNANFLMLVPVFAANAIPNGTNVAISFPTQTGFNYQVLYKNNLADPAWLPLRQPGCPATVPCKPSTTHPGA